MKIIDNYYVDSNGNKWDVNRFTEEEALKHSNTLINCNHCIDSKNCQDCTSCKNCEDCTKCSDSIDCKRCRVCNDCITCRFCKGCQDCQKCQSCTECKDCQICIYCIECQSRKGYCKGLSPKEVIERYLIDESDNTCEGGGIARKEPLKPSVD